MTLTVPIHCLSHSLEFLSGSELASLAGTSQDLDQAAAGVWRDVFLREWCPRRVIEHPSLLHTHRSSTLMLRSGEIRISSSNADKNLSSGLAPTVASLRERYEQVDLSQPPPSAAVWKESYMNWSQAHQSRVKCFPLAHRGTGGVTGLFLDELGGHVISAGADDSLLCTDLTQLCEINRVSKVHGDTIHAMQGFHNCIITLCDNIQLRDIRCGLEKPVITQELETYRLNTIAMGPEYTWGDDSVDVWDLRSFGFYNDGPVHATHCNGKIAKSIALHPSSGSLYVGTDKEILLFNLYNDCEWVAQLYGHTGLVNSLVLDDDILVSSDSRGMCMWWAVGDYAEEQSAQGVFHVDRVNASRPEIMDMQVLGGRSKENTRVLTGNLDGRLQVWDIPRKTVGNDDSNMEACVRWTIDLVHLIGTELGLDITDMSAGGQTGYYQNPKTIADVTVLAADSQAIVVGTDSGRLAILPMTNGMAQ